MSLGNPLVNGAPEPVAAYLVCFQVMDPNGTGVFWINQFAWRYQHVAEIVTNFKLADGYTLRDVVIAPSPIRIPFREFKQMGI